MKLPNGYGSVTKLSGARRRPYMVRITTGYDYEGRQQRYNRKGLHSQDCRAAIGGRQQNMNCYIRVTYALHARYIL